MAKPFCRPNGVYAIRIAIPPELRHLYQTAGHKPPEEKLVGLKTRNKKAADVAAARVVLHYAEEFEAKRFQLRAREAVTDDDLKLAARSIYDRITKMDEARRLRPPTETDVLAIWRHLQDEYGERSVAGVAYGPEAQEGVDSLAAWGIMQEVERELADPQGVRAERVAAIKAEAGRFGTSTVRREVAAFADEHHLDAEPGGDGHKRLGNAFQVGELQGHKRADERDAGDFEGEATGKLLTAPVTPRAKPGEGIMDLFEAFARANPRGNVADSINTSRRDVALFVSTLPPRSAVTAITRRAVADWKALLLQWPVKATETKEFRGMSMAEVVERNKDVGKPTISARTVNRHLSALGAFCDWLLAHDHIQASPTSRMHIHEKRKKGDGKPFPLDDLPKIFAAPLFTGAESLEKMRKPGNVTIRDHRYWFPLIMCFSGARPGELAQLLVEDVREAHGRWIMHITTENDEDKTVKTPGSMRVVPIHPELVRLGFLAHVEKMRKAGERKVFPETKQNTRGQWCVDFSSSFSDLLTDIGVKTETGPSKRLTLYSFRHSVSDSLRRAGFDDLEFAPLYGHGKATTTARYGHEQPRTIEQRAAMIDVVSYEGLDLSHLYPAA